MRRGFADIDAGADANAHQALDLERNQRFAHGRPRHFQLFGQIAFGRKLGADGVFAALDQAAKLIGDLAIQASCFHSLERHARLSLKRSLDGSAFLAWLGWQAIENWPYQLTKD